MKDIAHHTQHAVLTQSRAGHPTTRPDDHIMRQTAQQYDHLLSSKAFFAAFADAQSLLVTLEGGFDSTSPLVVEAQVGQEHGRRIIEQRERLAGQREDVLSRQGGDEHTVSELPVLLATAHRNALDGTYIGLSHLSHPAELARGQVG